MTSYRNFAEALTDWRDIGGVIACDSSGDAPLWWIGDAADVEGTMTRTDSWREVCCDALERGGMTSGQIDEVLCDFDEPDGQHKITICGNDETLVDGYFDLDGADLRDEAAEILAAGVAVIRDDPRVDYRISTFFQDWHGGTHSQAGAVIGETQYGYSAGWAVTHAVDTPQWLRELCEAVSSAMHAKARELSGRKLIAEPIDEPEDCESAADVMR